MEISCKIIIFERFYIKNLERKKLLGQNHDLNLFFNLALVLPLLMDQVYHFVAK